MYEGEVVEHHWNGHWGRWNHKVVKLLRRPSIVDGEPGCWALYVWAGSANGWPAGEPDVVWRGAVEETFDYRTERRAREDLAKLMSSHGDWCTLGGAERCKAEASPSPTRTR